MKGILQLIKLSHKSKRQPRIIAVKGKNVTNPKNIPNAFNIFLKNIDPSLSKAIPQSKRKFKKFLNNSSLSSSLYLSHLPMMRYENLNLN